MNDAPKQDAAVAPTPNVEQLLAAHGRDGFLRRWRGTIALAVVLLLVAGIVMLRGGGDATAPRYITETVSKGSMVVKVSATGNLEPTNQVDVGSELSGMIAAVFVDDDDRVTKGQELARLDLSKLQDAVAKSRGALAVAEAALQQALATEEETRIKLERYREVARLSGGKVPSKIEMDAAEAEQKRAQANAASARASILEAKASLQTEETNLTKAHIRSPIDGVVLERSVDPGQTVAASLQAVTLFTLAEDLSKMELKVAVDEADVGQVKAGLKATFTVDAWPGRRFEAVITRVGFNATDDGGVVSYPAVLQVANDDLSLRPGMTGTAEITTITRDNALLVPNAALRFTPPAAAEGQKSGTSVIASLMPRPPANAPRAAAPAAAEDGTQRIWVMRDGAPAPLQVKTGASNGRVTEIVGGGLQAGMEVITETTGGQP